MPLCYRLNTHAASKATPLWQTQTTMHKVPDWSTCILLLSLQAHKEAEREKAKAEKDAQKEKQRLAKEAEKERIR